MAVGTKQIKKEPRMTWGTAEISGPRHDYRERLLLGLVKRYTPVNAGILDAGCGGGSLVFKMASMGYQVHGIEASSLFVEKIRARLRERATDEFEVGITLGSVTHLPYSDASFDAVVSGEVLEHVEEDQKAIREFGRVLKTEGVCIVSVPAHSTLWNETDAWAGHVRRYEKNPLVRIFDRNGFRVEQILSWGFPLVKCYSRFLYLPYAKKTFRSAADSELSAVPERDTYRVFSTILGYLFHLDSLFGWFPYGIGWLLVARRTLNMK